MAIGNINKKAEVYITDDFKPYRDFLDCIHKLLINESHDGKFIKWRSDASKD